MSMTKLANLVRKQKKQIKEIAVPMNQFDDDTQFDRMAVTVEFALALADNEDADRLKNPKLFFAEIKDVLEAQGFKIVSVNKARTF